MGEDATRAAMRAEAEVALLRWRRALLASVFWRWRDGIAFCRELRAEHERCAVVVEWPREFTTATAANEKRLHVLEPMHTASESDGSPGAAGGPGGMQGPPPPGRMLVGAVFKSLLHARCHEVAASVRDGTQLERARVSQLERALAHVETVQVCSTSIEYQANPLCWPLIFADELAGSIREWQMEQDAARAAHLEALNSEATAKQQAVDLVLCEAEAALASQRETATVRTMGLAAALASTRATVERATRDAVRCRTHTNLAHLRGVSLCALVPRAVHLLAGRTWPWLSKQRKLRCYAACARRSRASAPSSRRRTVASRRRSLASSRMCRAKCRPEVRERCSRPPPRAR